MERDVRIGRWFWPACILLALIVRLIDFGPVYLQGEVRLIGPDPYYHLRRIALAVRDASQLPTFDPYLGHPFGALAPYEPGFDLLLAMVCRLVFDGARPTDQQLMAACAGIMPVLGLLVLPLYAAVARVLAGVRAAQATAVLVAVLPGVAFASQLGQVDHHVLEPLLIGLPLLCVMVGLEAPVAPSRLLLAGLGLGGGLFFWRGMILPAAILAAFLALRGAWQAVNGPVDRLTRIDGPLLFAVAAVVALPIGMASPVSERLSYFTISLLQPLVFALFALSLGLGGLVAARAASRVRAARAGRPARAAGKAALGLLLVSAWVAPFLVAAALLPSFVHNLLAGVGFLARANAFVQAVGEQRPLFRDDDGGFSLLYPVYFYGAFFVVAPVLARWAWIDRRVARGARPDFCWLLFGIWSLILLTMAVTQRRYAVQFAPVYAVWLGMGGVAGWRRLRTMGRPAQSAAAIMATLLALPTVGLTVAQAGVQVQSQSLLEAMAWIRDNTPRTSSFKLCHDAPGFAAPEYGVLAAWDEGHHLVTLAHRPNIANPFGIEWFEAGLQRGARCWLAAGDELAAAMDATGARYALVSFRLGLLRDEARFLGRDPDRYARWTPDGWQPGPDYAATAAARLYLEDGLGREGLPPMGGVRLLWEVGRVEPGSPAAKWVDAGAPIYKLFERVKGARFTGTSRPGSDVSGELEVTTPSGRRFVWRRVVKADNQGRWELNVPYAGPQLAQRGRTVKTSGLTVRYDGLERSGILVLESQVQAGSVIDLATSYPPPPR